MSRPRPQTEARANMIAQDLDGKPQMLGLGIASIITIIMDLLPTIIACFNPDSGTQAVEYVTQRFNLSDKDGTYRGYDKRLVKTMARRAKDAGRRNRQMVTWDQSYEIGFAALDNIRLGDANQANIAIAENHDFLLI